jgi:hypothetical protein
MTRMPIWTLAAVLPLAAAAQADIINVPADQPTIQAGIEAASDGDVVEVAPGTYPETIDFFGKAIALRSSDGRDVTAIDAQGAGSVVTCASGEGPDTVLEGFTITGGSATPASSGGGGMVNDGSSPMVIDCTFIGNTAHGSSGGAGGGMANFNSSPTVTSCAFISNSAELGGGMANFYSSSPTVTNCRFSGNIADDYGGGMLNLALSVGSNPTVTNCTFSGNAAGEGGGMLNSGGGSPIVTNCILWGNTAAIDAQINSGAVTYSDVQGGYFGDTNIDADPLFIDPDNGDLRFQPGSPCIDAGDNTAVPLDEYDLDSDGISEEPLPFDLDGNPRFHDDPGTADTGMGNPPNVDMGAYEFQGVTCLADTNDNGTVDADDLLNVILDWGTDGSAHGGDVDGGGLVDADDLVMLILAWGVCG